MTVYKSLAPSIISQQKGVGQDLDKTGVSETTSDSIWLLWQQMFVMLYDNPHHGLSTYIHLYSYMYIYIYTHVYNAFCGQPASLSGPLCGRPHPLPSPTNAEWLLNPCSCNCLTCFWFEPFHITSTAISLKMNASILSWRDGLFHTTRVPEVSKMYLQHKQNKYCFDRIPDAAMFQI